MDPNYILLLKALTAVVVLIFLIARWQVNAFLTLLVVSIGLGLWAGMDPNSVAESIQSGMGGVLGSIAGIIALGAMMGQLLSNSGGAEIVASRINHWLGPNRACWSIALIAFLVGLPVFFAVGLALLAPIVWSVSKNARRPVMWIGIPALAALSAAHGLVPPHPGPMTALEILGADPGKALILALVVAIPSAVLSGPVYAFWWLKLFKIDSSSRAAETEEANQSNSNNDRPESIPIPAKVWPQPSFLTSLSVLLAPAILMSIAATCHWLWPGNTTWKPWVDMVGSPLVAMLISTFYGCFVLAFNRGVASKEVFQTLESSLGPIASVLLVVGAGAGLNRTLMESGVGDAIAEITKTWSMSPLLLGWLVSALIRVATGSATVAITTSAGIIAPIALANPGTHLELLALSLGAGSLILSHVNDAGFWLVKEYFKLSLKETFRTWTALETLLSVSALFIILILERVL